MAETIQLDPSAIDATRTMVDITSFIKADGVDYGDAAIAAAMADQTFGSNPVDYRIPNRMIKIPLTLRTVGGTSFSTIRTNIQQKVALFQREGGSIMRQIDSTPYYADVVNATLHLGGDWLQAYRSADIVATLELECLPDWYGAEVTLSDHVETTAAELIFTEAAVNGSYPARTRIIVDNDQATDQHGLLWAVRSRTYSTATTARLAYEAESLQLLDASAKVAHAGASGGTVVQHPSLPANAWCPVMATNIGGTGYLTHQGSYRVWGRCYSGTATPQLRFLWDVGDLSSPTTNDAVALPTAGNFHLLDFGSVSLIPAPMGPHRWQGIIQANASYQGNQVEIDRLWFQPLDESAGQLSAIQPPSVQDTIVTNMAGTGAADNATGSITWTAPGNISADDSYSATSGPGPGTSYWLKSSAHGFTIPASATINGITVGIKKRGGPNIVDAAVRLIKAGTIQAPDKANTITPWTTSGVAAWTYYGSATDLWSGAWTATDINNSGFGAAISATISAGWLAIIDAITITVNYRLGSGFTSITDAVIFASRTIELRTEGMFRQDTGGTAYAPISSVVGDLPRLPPSGLESRTVEVLVKGSRGNLAEEPDAGIDDISAQIKLRPCYLFIG